MKQTTFEAQAFLEAVQFFRQEKGHYGSWEMMAGDETQVTRSSGFWLLFSAWEVGGQGCNKQSDKQSCKNGRCGTENHFSHGLERDFQPFSSHGTHKLIAEILRHAKKYIFCQSDKKIGIILIHSHWTAIVVLAVIVFLT